MDADRQSASQFRTRPVVVASSAGRLVAVDRQTVASVATIPCSPALPGSAPWVDGVGDHDGRMALVVAPFGHADEAGGDPAIRQVSVLILTGSTPLVAAIRVDGPASLADATPGTGGERVSAACPAAWLRPCRLGDGREAVLVSPDAIARSWVAA